MLAAAGVSQRVAGAHRQPRHRLCGICSNRRQAVANTSLSTSSAVIESVRLRAYASTTAACEANSDSSLDLERDLAIPANHEAVLMRGWLALLKSRGTTSEPDSASSLLAQSDDVPRWDWSARAERSGVALSHQSGHLAPEDERPALRGKQEPRAS